VICEIDKCRRVELAAPGPGTARSLRQEWSREDIWRHVEDILQVTGLAPNFELVADDKVGNAAAGIEDKKRVLYYNPAWIARIDAGQRWQMLGLLSHEIGHHLQGHTLLGTGSQPKIELEADRYAGFVLAKLGATNSEATGLWQTLSDRSTSTHPGRTERVAKVLEGWAAGGGKQAAATRSAASKKSPPAYILADSATKRLAARDIERLSLGELRLARNEVFARHGYVFDSEDLRIYFETRPWYRPRSKDVAISEIEKHNVTLIKAREAALGGEVRDNDYLLPQSSAQLLTRDIIGRLPPAQRRLARNEIYARHGYIFNDPKLAEHFARKRWYRATARSVTLTDIELYNVNLIRSLE
jgi:hypothetical protein